MGSDITDLERRADTGGVLGVYTPFRNDFVPLSFANLVHSYKMEGIKKCPIYLPWRGR
jgi:hypothetical protein